MEETLLLSYHVPCTEGLMLTDFLNIESVPSITPSPALLPTTDLLRLTFTQHGLWPNVASEDRSAQSSQ